MRFRRSASLRGTARHAAARSTHAHENESDHAGGSCIAARRHAPTPSTPAGGCMLERGRMRPQPSFIGRGWPAYAGCGAVGLVARTRWHERAAQGMGACARRGKDPCCARHTRHASRLPTASAACTRTQGWPRPCRGRAGQDRLPKPQHAAPLPAAMRTAMALVARTSCGGGMLRAPWPFSLPHLFERMSSRRSMSLRICSAVRSTGSGALRGAAQRGAAGCGRE